jgi:hypothetical protein
MEKLLDIFPPRRRPRACQQFLDHDGTEVDAWSIGFIKFTNKGESCAALEQVNIEIGIEKVLRH